LLYQGAFTQPSATGLRRPSRTFVRGYHQRSVFWSAFSQSTPSRSNHPAHYPTIHIPNWSRNDSSSKAVKHPSIIVFVPCERPCRDIITTSSFLEPWRQTKRCYAISWWPCEPRSRQCTRMNATSLLDQMGPSLTYLGERRFVAGATTLPTSKSRLVFVWLRLPAAAGFIAFRPDLRRKFLSFVGIPYPGWLTFDLPAPSSQL
jgi:hypothetical protein